MNLSVYLYYSTPVFFFIFDERNKINFPVQDNNVLLYCAVLCCAVLCCAVLCCAVLCCAVLYCIVLYCIVLYCIVLYCN